MTGFRLLGVTESDIVQTVDYYCLVIKTKYKKETITLSLQTVRNVVCLDAHVLDTPTRLYSVKRNVVYSNAANTVSSIIYGIIHVPPLPSLA